MTLWQVVLLSIVQGLAELLPVSSSAHVIVAEKLLGLDPSSPEMTLLLVMLHTGTMFAVIVYFWKEWKETFFRDAASFKRAAVLVIAATVLTGVVGGALIKIIEATLFRYQAKAEVEQLFSHLELIAPALLAVGVLILIAGSRSGRGNGTSAEVTTKAALLIGGVQGLALPFRGFSRSGATISTGLLAGVGRRRAEAFSFALAVVLTPPAVLREGYRLMHEHAIAGSGGMSGDIGRSLLGMVFAFLAGLVALRWLSRWLETGRWHLFGIYCVVAASVVFALWAAGF